MNSVVVSLSHDKSNRRSLHGQEMGPPILAPHPRNASVISSLIPSTRLGSKQAIWEGPPFLESLTVLVASFWWSLGAVPGLERLLVYGASVGHAFAKIVPCLFCCSMFTTCCGIARHAQRKSLVGQSPTLFCELDRDCHRASRSRYLCEADQCERHRSTQFNWHCRSPRPHGIIGHHRRSAAQKGRRAGQKH